MLKRRKNFVLIEVLIATGLFVLLLAAIFGIFWRTTKTTNALNRLRLTNEQMLVTQAKLQTAFSRLSFDKAIRPYFFSEIDNNSGLPSLIFTMGDTPQANAYIAPDVLVKLYIEDNQLILASFPHLKKNSGLPTMMQKEALLSQITDMKLEFFLPNELQKEETDAPTNSWVDNWQRDYDCPPALVKIELTKKATEKLLLWFYIPQSINCILYDKN